MSVTHMLPKRKILIKVEQFAVLISSRLDECIGRKYLRGEKRLENSLLEKKKAGKMASLNKERKL